MQTWYQITLDDLLFDEILAERKKILVSKNTTINLKISNEVSWYDHFRKRNGYSYLLDEHTTVAASLFINLEPQHAIHGK